MSDGLLLIGMILFTAIGVNLVMKRDNTVYVSAPYDQTMQYGIDKLDERIQQCKESGTYAKQIKHMKIIESSLPMNAETFALLNESPAPGAWAKEDEVEGGGPPYYVYRDESTGRSVTAVRGTAAYDQILNGLKR